MEKSMIFSLFMVLDFNPWFSDKYENIYPGFPISFRAIVLSALYLLWGLEMIRRVVTVRLFLSVTIPFAFIVAWSALQKDTTGEIYTWDAGNSQEEAVHSKSQ